MIWKLCGKLGELNTISAILMFPRSLSLSLSLSLSFAVVNLWSIDWKLAYVSVVVAAAAAVVVVAVRRRRGRWEGGRGGDLGHFFCELRVIFFHRDVAVPS